LTPLNGRQEVFAACIKMPLREFPTVSSEIRGKSAFTAHVHTSDGCACVATPTLPSTIILDQRLKRRQSPKRFAPTLICRSGGDYGTNRNYYGISYISENKNNHKCFSKNHIPPWPPVDAWNSAIPGAIPRNGRRQGRI